MKWPSRKTHWWEVREGFWIAWFITFGIVGLLSKHGPLNFAAGINFGFAVQKVLDLKHRRMISQSRQQDWIDLRTLHDIGETMSYKGLHRREKSALN